MVIHTRRDGCEHVRHREGLSHWLKRMCHGTRPWRMGSSGGGVRWSSRPRPDRAARDAPAPVLARSGHRPASAGPRWRPVLSSSSPMLVVLVVLASGGDRRGRRRRWLGALVLGRLPAPAQDVLTGWLRLADPGLRLSLPPDRRLSAVLAPGDARYPVRVTDAARTAQPVGRRLPARPRRPRPGGGATATYGIATAVLVVSGSSSSCTGRLPPSFHQVFAAFVRYQARLTGYLALLTSEYPWGLLGDPEIPDGAGRMAKSRR